MQGVTSASHVERDDVKGLTYDFTMDFTARLKGMYHLFCIPDDVQQEPYLLAKIQDDPCYIHRYVAYVETSLLLPAAVSNSRVDRACVLTAVQQYRLLASSVVTSSQCECCMA